MPVPMRHAVLAATAVIAGIALAAPVAFAQQAPPPAAQGAPGQPQPPQLAPPRPYKPLAVKPPGPFTDPSLEAFRKQIAAVAQRKDRAALAKMVVTKGFFWENEDGNGADPKKSGADNFAEALGLDAKDGSGWEALAGITADPTAAPDPDKKGVVCSPAGPSFDDKAFEDLVKATQTDPAEWGYPVSDGVEVRAAPQPGAAVTEKLGLNLVRVMYDDSPAAAVNGASEEWTRIVTPGGKIGFVAVTALNALVSDQICYLKDGSGWRIAGIVGGGGQ
jgi:hypothetical protein